jgi:hypothetical protein
LIHHRGDQRQVGAGDSAARGWRNLIATLGKSENERVRFPDMSLPDELQPERSFLVYFKVM